MLMTCGRGRATGQRVARPVLCKQGVGASSPLVPQAKALVYARIGQTTCAGVLVTLGLRWHLGSSGLLDATRGYRHFLED
jgi:hypothetical protein